MPRILYLNRIFSESNSFKKHEIFLNALQECFDVIVYSFGMIELDDVDFPDDYSEEMCKEIEKKTLSKKNGWTYTGGLYIWNNSLKNVQDVIVRG